MDAIDRILSAKPDEINKERRDGIVLSYAFYWRAFLQKARESLPTEIRSFVTLGIGVIPNEMPPEYLAEYHNFKIEHEGIAPIRISFSPFRSTIIYEVPGFRNQAGTFPWIYSEAEIFHDHIDAIRNAKAVFDIRASFIKEAALNILT